MLDFKKEDLGFFEKYSNILFPGLMVVFSSLCLFDIIKDDGFLVGIGLLGFSIFILQKELTKFNEENNKNNN